MTCLAVERVRSSRAGQSILRKVASSPLQVEPRGPRILRMGTSGGLDLSGKDIRDLASQDPATRNAVIAKLLVGLFRSPLRMFLKARGVQDADAEDLVQDLFVRVLVTSKPYNSNLGNLLPWLRAVLQNLWIDRRKSQRIHPYLPLPAVLAGSAQDDPAAITQEKEERLLFAAALEKCDPVEIAIITGKYLEGKTLQEIGEELGRMPTSTVQGKIMAVRDRLFTLWRKRR